MIGKRPESVLVVVHTRAGEALLLRRTDLAAGEPEFWQSVTGSLEAGETPLEAARRELIEETGLSPDGLINSHQTRRFPIAPPWRDRYAASVTHNVEHEFRLAVPRRAEVRLQPREHAEYRWLPRAEAIDLASSWTDRAALRAVPAAPADTTVVLLHGLWMGAYAMRPLARRLRAAGFRTALFGYRSTVVTPAEVARRLATFIDGLEGTTIHLVAHSLGGIVLAHLLNAWRPGLIPGRIGRAVLLGSPMRGSAAAEAMNDHRHRRFAFGRLPLGRLLGTACEQGLDGNAPPWPREIPVATIAGTLPLGPVAPLRRLSRPHDGTVSLRETGIRGAVRMHFRVTHLGLLVSRQVAQATIAFLQGSTNTARM